MVRLARAISAVTIGLLLAGLAAFVVLPDPAAADAARSDADRVQAYFPSDGLPERALDQAHWALIAIRPFASALQRQHQPLVSDRYGTRETGAEPGRAWYRLEADYLRDGERQRYSVLAQASWAAPPGIIFPGEAFDLPTTVSVRYSEAQRGPSFRAGWVVHSYSTRQEAFDFGPYGIGLGDSMFHRAARVPSYPDHLNTDTEHFSLTWIDDTARNRRPYRLLTVQFQSRVPHLFGVTNVIYAYQYFPQGAAGADDHPASRLETGTMPMIVIESPEGEWVILRAAPGEGQQATARLVNGMVVELLERSDGWLNVMLIDGSTGWIAEAEARALP